jgi:hypothetical protein
MKKALFSALFTIVCGVLFCFNFNSKAALSASATNDISVHVRKILTTAEAAYYSDTDVTILPGDYLVSVVLDNNTTGFCTLSATVGYNQNYVTPVTVGGSEIYSWVGDDSFNYGVYYFSYNQTLNVVGITCASVLPNNGDGEIINYFLRPNSGSVPSNVNVVTGLNIVSISNNSGSILEQYNYSSATYYKRYLYLVGDVDGDGTIVLDDAMYVNDVVDDYISVSESNPNAATIFANYGCTGMFAYDGTFIFGVADVNGDGVVNSADVNELNYYYSLVLMHATAYYTGLINTYQYYDVEYSY